MPVEQEAIRHVAGSHHASRRRVLIVDDDPTFRLLATETLEPVFEAQTVSTAQEAATAFELLRPDLVLLDADVPGGNGFDLCRAIRSARTNSDVPVILVTGLDDPDSIHLAYAAGATDFMHKPVLWPMLPHRVEFVLRAHDDRRALARSEKRNRALLQALPDASVIIDSRGFISEHFPGSDSPRERSLIGQQLEEAFPPVLALIVRRALAEGASATPVTCEYEAIKLGAKRWFEARVRPQADGSLLIVMRDTTERRKSKARAEYLAYYDVLTGLPNRTLFLRRAAQTVQDRERQGRSFAVIYLDLDRFKRVNDNLGHALGDALLKLVGRRLREVPGSLPHHLARLGGDEFVLLVEVKDEREASQFAERIRLALAEPLDLGTHRLVLTPSIGIAMYPRDSTSLDDLLIKADMAMYVAKDRGRNGHAFFGQSVAVRSLGRLALESDMRRAVELGQFAIAYQPKLDLASGKVVGVEALLRWTHPERGPIPPDRFIPVAEETGLIVPLGQWVLDQVCEQLSRWTSMGFEQLTAAVNVSVQQFERPDFVETVFGTLAARGVDPSRLELEITETLLSRNLSQTTASMAQLRARGIALSIDDFGTGYSSLKYLRQLPVCTLKIDRSFVADLSQSEDAAAICTAILALARELKLNVVAEGVETAEQLEFLRRHRCSQVQGYLIGRPVPAHELESLLRDRATV